MIERTALYHTYKNYPGAKLVDFHGWELPVQFEAGITAEHNAVRHNAGLFDVSHMGEIIVRGKGSEKFISYLVTARVQSRRVGRCVYSPMCYPTGGTVDDLLIYRTGAEEFLLVVNASNREKDYQWITSLAVKHAGPKVSVQDVSSQWSQLALQGPNSQAILAPLTTTKLEAISFFRFLSDVKVAGKSCLVSRTGYTGEDGFELYMDTENAPAVWEAIMESAPAGGNPPIPCGLGARDTLRLEAGLPLYGHELDQEITPVEAGLKAFISLEKDDFCGKNVLLEAAEKGPKQLLFGCIMTEKGVPREGCALYKEENRVGFVASGSKSPTLDAFIATVFVDPDQIQAGEKVEIDIRGKRKAGKLVSLPFYTRKSKGS